jgi:hypothetical protein
MRDCGRWCCRHKTVRLRVASSPAGPSYVLRVTSFRAYRIPRRTALWTRSHRDGACPALQSLTRAGISSVRGAYWFGTFRLAHPAINTLLRVDDEHVLTLVKAVHRAHFDAVHRFAANTCLVDDVGQLSVLSAGRSGELIHGVFALLSQELEDHRRQDVGAATNAYSTRGPARQPISQKSVSSRVASLKIAISSASRAGVA